MTRVMLTEWEWACCGDPFSVGDNFDFGIQTRAPAADLAELVGEALAATVDAVESHHEEELADRVRGRVVAIHAVTHEVIERRTVRRPGHGAPLNATMPTDGGDWPMAGCDLGNGVFVGSRPSRYVTEVMPVPDSVTLTPADGVRLPVENPDKQGTCVADGTDAPPAERRTGSLVGWLIDIEEH